VARGAHGSGTIFLPRQVKVLEANRNPNYSEYSWDIIGI
jgi:hypothetical protein